MEVVEWLKWYREAINDIVAEKKMMNGSAYFDILERDFCSATHQAYYGPVIESLDLLPNSFEAEVRSFPGTPEVLNLASSQDLFGMVCLADKVVELSQLTSSQSVGSEVHQQRLGKMDMFVPTAYLQNWHLLSCDHRVLLRRVFYGGEHFQLLEWKMSPTNCSVSEER